MYRQYKKPIMKASPDIKICEPRVSKLVIFLCKLFGRLYLFLFLGVAKTVLQGEKYLIEAFQRALAGKSRCIIAFRHPNGGEPQILGWFFLFKLRKLAAKHGVRFARWPHAAFVYGFEVVRWGGWVSRFLMPNAGAMPIHHAKMDTKGMARINKAIDEGPYPLAIAPEGQVSFFADTIIKLDPGVIRIGFSAAERLAQKKPDCPVEILPLSVHFRFGSWGKFTLELLLRKIEKACGISHRGRQKPSYVERVERCRTHLLEVNETRYSIKKDNSVPFEERLTLVLNTALETAERMMSVKSEGEFFPRMHKLRQLCWDRIFLPGVDELDSKTNVERNVLDLQSGEAWFACRHIEVADFCWFFRVPLPTEETPFHEKIEYAQNLWDFTSRTMGGAFRDRISIFPRKVIIQAAPVINLTERLPSYKTDRKAAITTALADLKQTFIDCIIKANSINQK